jgi:hypothetical protein
MSDTIKMTGKEFGEQPANPCNWIDFQPTTGEQVVRQQFPGLTKREWFAGLAMQGMLSASDREGRPDDIRRMSGLYAEASAIYADALLAELSKEVK